MIRTRIEQMAARGLDVGTIAIRLGIRVSTVQRHIPNVSKTIA